ncbi:MAG: hypothetical protein WBE26_00850, partial [Phycisphaerae bacterium]
RVPEQILHARWRSLTISACARGILAPAGLKIDGSAIRDIIPISCYSVFGVASSAFVLACTAVARDAGAS